jgi:hypothetical protein
MYLSRKPKLAEFETDIEFSVPSEAEIEWLTMQNYKCNYYYMGIAKCREAVLKRATTSGSAPDQHGFLPCKEIVDAHYRCMSNKKFGQTLEEAPAEAQQFAKAFKTCAFKKLNYMEVCRGTFDNAIRMLYRGKESPLK